MKNTIAGWVQPFVFKNDQRKELLNILPKRSTKDKQAANCFVESAQREVESWLSIDIQLLTTTPKNHKEKLERLAKAAVELRAALDNIPDDTGAYLEAEVYTTLYCDPYKRNHFRIGQKLKQLGNLNPCDENFLEELLDVVKESANRTASNYEVRTGENKTQLISLTAKLANCYSQHFQKPPTAGNGSNFRKFMGELSRILGYDFGAQTVKDGIERVKEVHARAE